ncbi:ABC transporter [Spathaspora passalidarum NRRL Y-27907]|uniref:ABC transporter n=1 Tax=Spathaspora passalidarum (strain NRRL Y-27907 / 11-Y1) TaxID=619300 RepID=G3AQM1_SPAPN|nr:ABC transporter [Spathaspora passalidarum NRRL Y-27907]EGW31568.1 ABC transporter [Spathaspora passalidarum NRRL Y-27907]
MSNTSTTICPFWHYDDITDCAKYNLQLYPAAIVGLVSFAILLVKSTFSYVKSVRRSYHDLPEESKPLLDVATSYGSATQESISEPSAKSQHFDLARLPETNEDGTPHGTVELVYKSISERARVSIEYILVIAALALHLLPFFVHAIAREFKHAKYVPYVQSGLWTYLFLICTIRIVNLKRVSIRLPSLWIHSTAIYFFNFFPSLFTFRSALVHHGLKSQVRQYYIVEFAINVILLYLNFTAKVGDKPSQLYRTPGVEPSPENVSSIASFIAYSWIDKMIWKAHKSPLKNEDIWGLRQDDYALHVLKGFEASKSTFRFTYKLFAHFKFLFAIQAFWAVLESMLVFGPSLLLKKVLEYVADPESIPQNLAWTFVLLMPVVKMADSISSGCSLFLGRRVCCRMKAIIIGQVYAKALRRKVTVTETMEDEEIEPKTDSDEGSKKESKKTAELGAIINLMAIDAFKVSEVCGYLHFFVSAILMIVICTLLLYSLLGWSALVGSFAIFALLPISFSLARWLGRLQKKMLKVTDARIQKLNETFQSIRIVKFFAWEDKFFENVMGIRNEELYYLKFRSAVWCASAFVWFITPTLVTLLSFYCYTIIEGKPLTAPLAFTSLSLFTLLRSPLDQLADMTSFVIQSKVSLDRISDFLDEPETTKYDQLSEKSGNPNAPTIGFENAILSWNSKSATDFKLRDLNIDFKVGKLNVIIGPTGAGKTSLLLGLLGEMDLISGHVHLPGLIPRDELIVDRHTGLTDSIAYCSQSPWLLNETIRNNICFGTPYIQERYDAVVDACGLSRDFQILSAGDATEIGEKGITLSGGQKQRVSLARALYSNSKHLLLDDCLSAVDSHTALWIYENCISGPLMQGRTCILVSHNVALTVQKAEWVVVLENGRVKSQGTAEELLAAGDLGDDDLVKSSVLSSREQSSTNLQSLSDKNADMKAKAAAIDTKLRKIQSQQEEVAAKTDGKLVEEENKAEGVVGSDVYLAYAKYFGGWSTWTLVVIAFVVSQGVFIIQTFWLRKWSSESSAVEEITMRATQLQQSYVVRSLINPVVASFNAINAYKEAHTTLYYISMYAVIGFTYGFASCFRLYVTFFAGIKASSRIFETVLKKILRAKLRFFDKTPLGRIMNRFSKDIEAVDQELTPFAEGVFMCLVQCVSTLVLITFITPGFLVFAVIISFLYYLVGYFYLTLSRELKRYESITKSPIHQHFSESLNGVATIRAYGIESRFMKQNLKAIDANNRPFFYLWVANRWLAFRIDAVGSMVMLCSGIFVLLSIGKIDSGLAGLSLSYAIAFSESALWVVRLYSTVEMNMNSMERLQEYLDVEQEPPYEIKETEPRSSWPEHGRISVKDVSLRYAPELPRVIKNVTFDVEPCNKVGIVGRTGAGKSTIITAFFRFLDPETGSITIDGVDITSIGLRNLRQAITIIPQDPTLFSGTIRSNLDPFGQYTDVQIFEALRRVNLISASSQVGTSQSNDENQNKFLNLDNSIAEGGGNLSQGERQLICLARSLLKNPKVILLDEATSSIDYKSDAMIQQTIREEFGTSTILTIAHRLRTIIDYDKILVMDAGRVVEYDNPYVLLTDQSSLFYSMCENSGELDSLIRLAKEAYIKNKNSLRK